MYPKHLAVKQIRGTVMSVCSLAIYVFDWVIGSMDNLTSHSIYYILGLYLLLMVILNMGFIQ